MSSPALNTRSRRVQNVQANIQIEVGRLFRDFEREHADEIAEKDNQIAVLTETTKTLTAQVKKLKSLNLELWDDIEEMRERHAFCSRAPKCSLCGERGHRMTSLDCPKRSR